METELNFETALQNARKYVGNNPNIHALPKIFTTAGMHLMMKNEILRNIE